MCLRLQNLPTLTQLYMDMTRTYHPSTYYTYVRQEIKFKKKMVKWERKLRPLNFLISLKYMKKPYHALKQLKNHFFFFFLLFFIFQNDWQSICESVCTWSFSQNDWKSILVWGVKNLRRKGWRAIICKIALEDIYCVSH
jgi:hypothetical protein